MYANFLKNDIIDISLPKDFVALISSVSDIAFITDRNGVILDMIWKVDGHEGFDPKILFGASLMDIVTEESRPKIVEMLEADGPDQGGRQREINHRIEGIEEFPVRYSAVGAGESVIFLGHEIRAIAALQSRLVEAQRALDQDYSRLRQLETQYRVLFQTSSEALLIIDAGTARIEDANASASQVLDAEIPDLKGKTLVSVFNQADGAPLREAMHSVVTTGQSDRFRGHLLESGAEVECSLSIFRASNATLMLCTLTPSDSADALANGVEDMLIGMLGRIPDAMVLTDMQGSIRWCNDAFLGMSEVALQSQIDGEPLARFLGRPGVDIEIIIQNAREHGRIRAFSSIVTGAYGSETRVEVSVAALSEPQPMIGFVMRDINRYDQIPARKPQRTEESAADLMNLVGSVPLKDVVRASTEQIEKMCIETALKKTGNNRASAAEMLGLSRQSLYVKLRRFGLLDKDGR